MTLNDARGSAGRGAESSWPDAAASRSCRLSWVISCCFFYEACHYKIGTTLQVVYVEQDGRSDVKSVIPVPLHARQ